MTDPTGIAVIGMAGRFPGAPDLQSYWRNLRGGVESVRFFEEEELRASGVAPDLLSHPEYVRAGSVLEGIDLFDAPFFGYGPAEAEILDPQQRFFLQYAWLALEDAGYAPAGFDGSIGVYGGATMSMYLMRLAAHPQLVAHVGSWEAGLGNAADFLATRVAYKLNLEGPALTVQTACSTSLLAIHLACQGLLDFEADLALAGGVTIRVPHHEGYLYREGGILSPDGHTRPFDAAGRGTIFGSGVGIVVLKRLEEALEDGDRILAVIRGSAVNNDGSNKVGFTAPSLKKQADVIAEALGAADVDPETVSYVEAHGTGTELGDPIEVAALTRAFASRRRGYCALGSVKSNIGHLDIASGVASFIKTVLALKAKELPPSLNFETPNPKIDFDGSPFFVNRELRPWESPEGPRRAGVSSFGFGGTNVHLILEEGPPAPAPAPASRPGQVLVLSAKTETALAESARRLAGRLEEMGDGDLADAAFTLQQGREALAFRTSVAAENPQEAAEALRRGPKLELCEEENAPVVFLFPGQGAQYPGMAEELWREEAAFREVVDEGARILQAPLGEDLRSILFPSAGEEPRAAAALRRTELTQPALYVVEVALARLWQSFGIEPRAMIGHSVGELAAACVAGVFTFEEGLRLVAERGRLMGGQPVGAMLAVGLAEGELASWLGDRGEGPVELAAANAPESSVVAGPVAAIEALARGLEKAGVEHRRLHTSHGFHTESMEPAAKAFAEAFAGIELQPPRVPYLSNVTGHWIRPEEATDPAYWARQLRQPVRFSSGVQRLLDDGSKIFLEVGPGETLGKLVSRHEKAALSASVISSLAPPRHRCPASATMLEALGRLWQAGAAVDWQAVNPAQGRQRTSLPGYPFEGRSYWIEVPGGSALPAAPSKAVREAEPALHERPELRTSFEAPEGATEIEVARLFGTMLRLEGIGRRDDFFELGGDSLMATSLLSRLRDQYRVKVSLDELFAEPTVAGLAAAVEVGRQRGDQEDQVIRRIGRDGPLPVSFGQQRLWFLQQIDPELGAYNLPGCLRLEGALAPQVFHRAISELARRHESLRTTFRLPTGETEEGESPTPLQVIAPRIEVPVPVVDFSRLPEKAAEPLALHLLSRELGRPFLLDQGPLIRALLIRLRTNHHLALLTTHHTVSDGWSWSILSRELGELYRSFAAGRASALPELPIQYADFAAWQREWLAGGALEEQLGYWRETLKPLPPPLSLPADRQRPAVQSYRGRKRWFVLPEELSARAGEAASGLGVTPFMLYLAAFQALLGRWSGQRDFAVGTPVANRRWSQIEGVIGFFVNTLVLRTDLDGDPTVEEILERVKTATVGAFAHQDVPFDRLVDDLKPERDLATTPLFQAMFVLQNAPLEEVDLDQVVLSPIDLDPGTAMFDLTLSLMETPDGVEGSLEYSTDLFDATTMERFFAGYRRVLGEMLSKPGERLSRLAPLGGEARQQVLVEWNDTDRTYPRGSTLPDLVEAQARRTPGATAVLFEDERLTYRELMARADALAASLRDLGVGPEQRVGVCLERSSELVVSLLAVMRAGAAYVPLDPDYPPARLEQVLTDARVGALVTRRSVAEVLPEMAVPLVDVGNPAWLKAGGEPGSGSGAVAMGAGRACDRNLAYVIFTSGSTGRPKGAMNEHRGIVNRLLWMQERFGLTAEDRVLQKTPFSFDVSVWEFFWPLLTGATLVVARPGGHREPGYLAETVRRRGVTTLHFVPSMLQAFLEEESIGTCATLKRVVLSGEALSFELEQRFFERLPWVRLENLYGPTEAAVDVSYHRCAPAAHRRPVPIGRPVANTSLLVLDRSFRPTPSGVAGEVCIGGIQVGRGYLGRPALTAERFVPDPAATKPGARLYRTGDLARFLPTGEIEYLGRIDFQVKVRGFRIELGEIESVLASRPQVREAVVTARKGASGAPRLVAYVVPADGVAGETGEVKDLLSLALAETLPEYMVPSAFVVLEALPLTPSGKVDRRALPEPDWETLGAAAYGAPSSFAEETLTEVWAAVLGLPQVGVHDNFFSLGGDSILAIQVVSRAGQRGLKLHPRALFQHQTVAELAAVAEDGEEAPAAEQGEVTGEAPLTPIQRWFFEADHPRPGHWNQALLLASREPVSLDALETALQALLNHHDVLRSVFVREGGAVFQKLRPVEDGLPLVRLDLSAVPRAERPGARRRALEEAQASLDLEKGPAVRFLLFDSGAGVADRLLVVAHHLVVDGVSWRILAEDLETAYGQAARGLDTALPPKTSSWTAWARAAASFGASGRAALGSDRWRSLSEGTRPLPEELGAGPNTEGSVELVETRFHEDETAAFLKLTQEGLRAAPDELLLAAIGKALAAWSGRDALLVDVEGHGRDLPVEALDVSRTVGWFTELHPVRLDLNGEADAATALRAAKAGLRDGPAGYGYGFLRYGFSPSEEPLPEGGAGAQVLFNYLGRLDPASEGSAFFRPVDENSGPWRSPENPRRHLFEINAAVTGGVLRISWAFCRHRHRRETVEALVQTSAGVLRDLLAVARSGASAAALVPSDLPLAGLRGEGFRRLLAAAPALEDAYPLTPVQEGMLFHSLYAEGSGVYHEQLVCRLEGPLDEAAFGESWKLAVERHGPLRTIFLWEGFPRPLQVVLPFAELPLQTKDWSSLEPEAADEALGQLLEADRRRPFQLSSPPLSRLVLVRTGPSRHLFVWSFHHLILDGWSASVVLRDVLAAYRSRTSGEEPELAAVRPFRDLVRWLEGRDDEGADEYWRSTLGDLSSATPLGLPAPAREGRGERGSRTLLLPAETSETLRLLGRRRHLTLPTLVQAAWALLLGRLSSSADVVFGTTLAGRPAELPGVETMVGMFINSLPLRLEVPAQEPLLAWLGEVQRRQQELSRWQTSSLSRAQAQSGVPQGESLFESLFVFENYPVDSSLKQMEGSLAVEEAYFVERTNDPLVLVAVPGRRMLLRAGYERDLLDDTAVQRLLGQLAAVLAAFVEIEAAGDGESRVLSTISPLTAPEAQQVLTEWNDPTVGYSGAGLLHGLVEAQAARVPQAEAVVVAGGARLTYGELNARANQVAHWLRARGAGVESRVGVCLERSPLMVVGLLGILKSGAAYVPLDPEYPRERLAVILEDVGVAALVTEEARLEDLPTEGAEILCLDRDEGELAHLPQVDPRVPMDAGNLAYVIHTSGSTGRPKGVMIPHRGVVNRLTFASPAGHLRSGDRFLQKASIGFDVSLLEIFLPLSVGGATVLARPGGHRDPEHLVGLMAEEGVHQAIFPPSLLRLVVEEPGLVRCRSLHSVASSAEALPVELQKRFFETLQADLYNRYGPTEASIAASSWRCERQARHRIVPIGRPIAKASVYLLGPELQPVPTGAAGELFIGGPGLARGYFGRPGRTAEAFVPNPFSASPGERLYCTGDLARYRPDGAMEFLGRVDHQVKIRGYRVELGEIESVLKEQPGVAQVLVTDREDTPGVKRLVAYVVVEEGAEPDGGTLRQAVAETLPDYMVPAAVVFLDEFPLTPNGKVDRKALPAPELGRELASAEYEAPRSEIEQTLARVWQEVLGVPQVGLHDDFFELGGDSILSIRVVSRANEAGLRLNVRHLFENRTVAELAAVAGSGARIDAEQGIVTGDVPLTPIQHRFFDHPLADPSWVNQSLLLEVDAGFQVEHAEAALDRILEHHDALRLRFVQEGGTWKQSLSVPEGGVSVERFEIGDLEPEQQRRAVEEHCTVLQGSLDLEKGPLLRAAYFDAGPSRPGRFFLAIHHLAVDGVSWRILLEDLENLIQRRAAGEELSLPAKTSSYKAWAERLVAHGASPELQEEAAYWLTAARQVPVTLPVDGPVGREGNTEDSVEEVRASLDAESTARLLETVPEVYRTGIQDALLAALGRAFQSWTGSSALTVDLESHGRDHDFEEVDVNRTVGWFTALFPVRIDLAEARTADEALKAVKEQMRRFPGGGLGYGLLRYVAPEGDARRLLAEAPQAEVAFNYLGQVEREASGSQLFRLSRDPAGPARSPEGRRRYLLEVNCSVVGGELELIWTFSPNVHRRQTVEALAERLLAALRETLEAAESPEAGGYTPSDFEDVDLDQDALDSILAQVGGE